jgi:hypothetical protein
MNDPNGILRLDQKDEIVLKLSNTVSTLEYRIKIEQKIAIEF